jgi:hypothetical protein
MVSLSAAFLVGIVVGVAALCLLSSRASRLYVQMVRLAFASEEERRLVAAWNRGDLNSAARHAACGIEAEGEMPSFDPANSLWDLSFPMMGLWANDQTKYPVTDRKSLLALAHSRMGLVLERQGRTEDAAKEYTEAAQVGGGGSVEKWRSAAATVLVETKGAPPTKQK